MRYPKFKDTVSTSVSWIGELPKDWSLVRLGFLFDLQRRPPRMGQGVVTAFRDGQVTLRSKRRLEGFTEADKEIGYQTVLPGDLVIHAMDGFAGAIGVSDSEGKCSPVCSVCKPREGVDSRFFGYVMRHIALSGFITSLAKGIRERSTDFRWTDARLLPVPVPPNAAQIVAFIRRETAKIDRLIVKQERLIALLQEKRQSVISRAVTKGLDPNVKMKDSGVEWLGEVPEHWQIQKVSLHFRCKKGKDAAILTKEYCASIEGEFPVYSGQTENDGVMASINRFEFDFPEQGVLFSTTVGAKAMTVMHIQGRFSLSQNCMIIVPESRLSVKFYFYCFQPLFRYERGLIPEHMQASFRMEDLYAYRIPIIPSKEAEEIARYLDAVNSQLHNLEEKAGNSISLLKEHRQALISAAVTGKIDVRGLVSDEEVAALDAEPEEMPHLEAVEDASYITEEEQG